MEVPVPVAVLALRGVVRAAAPGSCHSYSRVSRVLLLLLLLRSPEAGGRRQRDLIIGRGAAPTKSYLFFYLLANIFKI